MAVVQNVRKMNKKNTTKQRKHEVEDSRRCRRGPSAGGGSGVSFTGWGSGWDSRYAIDHLHLIPRTTITPLTTTTSATTDIEDPMKQYPMNEDGKEDKTDE